MTWVLFDYGNVLSLPQPKADVETMAAAAGTDLDSFEHGYWKHRLEFDKGTLTPREYWSLALGRDVGDEEVARLVELDIASWTHPNRATLAVMDRLPRVALLSNAPDCIAEGIDGLPWMTPVEPRFYSGRMGLSKPDPEIYLAVLDGLGAAPGEVTFVDDRLVNVEAAERVGLVGVHFREAADLAYLVN
ncbi:HAD family hydrolase [Nonomuraea sp. NPDC059194]|uniref:HAD family hydrolase n=1 Tax=Nonomuraea sp. NPDC059194 TaxID=3346764 RepID=UPI00368C66E5